MKKIIVKAYLIPIDYIGVEIVKTRKFKKYGFLCKLYVLKQRILYDYVEVDHV